MCLFQLRAPCKQRPFFPLRTAPIYLIYISTQNLNMVDCEDWAHCKEELVGGKREEGKVLHSQCFHHQSKIKDKVGNQICYWNKFCSSVFMFLFIFPRKRSALSKLSSFLAGTQTTILAFLWWSRLKRKTNTPTEAKHSLWRCATTSYLYPESFCLLNLAGSNCANHPAIWNFLCLARQARYRKFVSHLLLGLGSRNHNKTQHFAPSSLRVKNSLVPKKLE